MSLLKLKLYYNTNALELNKKNIFRHLEGGEATWLSSDISTIPVSELNLSSTQHRYKLILESSCVHIYVKYVLLYYQSVHFCNKTSQVDWAGSDNNTNNIEQLLTDWCISLEQVQFWAFPLLWALKHAKVGWAGSAITGSNAVSTFKQWDKVKPCKVLKA